MKFDRVSSLNENLLFRLGLVGMTVGAGIIGVIPSSQAVTATTNFACARVDGKPTTVARTKKGNVPIVVWNSADFSGSGFTPQVRCQQVSARFQTLYRTGQLKYITAGTLNKLPVLCGTKQLSATCNRQNLLYTLKPNADPQLVIKRLMMIRNRATSSSVEESAPIPTTNSTSTNSIELNWLEED